MIPYGRQDINQRDIDQKRKIAIIGKRVKKQLFDEDALVIGEYIKIQGNDFLVFLGYR